MADICKILAFAGSTRKGSFNKMLVTIAMEGARHAGAEVTCLDLRDYPLPLYDGDLEESKGLPPHARKLKDLMISHQGFLIASPEYNSSFSGVLKNTIDWVSRPVQGEPMLACFKGKTAAIMSASPGALGGLRGLVHLRALLGNLSVLIVPEQIAIPQAMDAFNSDGLLKDAKKNNAVKKIGAVLYSVTHKLNQ